MDDNGGSLGGVHAAVGVKMDAEVGVKEVEIVEEVEEREYVKQGKVTSQFCWNGMIVSKEQLAHTLNHAHRKVKGLGLAQGIAPGQGLALSPKSAPGPGLASAPGQGLGLAPLLPTTYDLSSPCQLAAFVKETLDGHGHGHGHSESEREREGEGEGERGGDGGERSLGGGISDSGNSGSSNSSSSSSSSGSNNDCPQAPSHELALDPVLSHELALDPVLSHELALDPVLWIMKRYRGRQSMDYPITSYLPCALRYCSSSKLLSLFLTISSIINPHSTTSYPLSYPSYSPCISPPPSFRHLESSPRLAAKYLTHPATLAGRKFDLRYYVIVTSLQPLIVHRHQMFSIRLANHVYSCDDLEQVQGQGLAGLVESNHNPNPHPDSNRTLTLIIA